VTPAHSLLASVLALGLLHLVMLLALYVTRIPAMAKARMTAQAAARPGALDSLPSWARNVAANYNNLAEAPTVFYAVVIAIVLLDVADSFYVTLAWTCVALRYVHSVIQATVNRVIWRFAAFSLSWLALGVMIVRALLGLSG